MRLVEAKLNENGLEYAKHQDYGYLLTCPSGIGTALRAGVHMKLPRLLRVSGLWRFDITVEERKKKAVICSGFKT